MVRLSNIVWNPIDEKVIKSFVAKMIEDVKSYRKKCLFPVLLFSAMVTSAQINFQQILGVVYPGTFSTDVSSFWFFLPEFHFLVVVQRSQWLVLFWTHPHWPVINMLQSFLRPKKYEGTISVEQRRFYEIKLGLLYFVKYFAK